MKIDPITGEIINEEQESVAQTQEVQSQPSGGFDPMTGEPIGAQSQPSGGFDPMTGEPMGTQSQPSGGFDPMTGAPIGAQSQPSGGFDPMTGAPIGAQSQPSGGFDPMTGAPMGAQSQPSGGFDPMTGAPMGAQSQPNGGFDPMTGAPMGVKNQPTKPANKTNILIPIIGVAAVALIVIVAAVIINSGLFLSPYGKIEKALVNAFKEKPHIVEDLQALDMLSSGEFTLAAKMTSDDENMVAEYRSKSDEKQVYIEVDGEDANVSILAGVDKSKLKIQSSELLGKQVVVYDFTADNDGYIVEDIDEDTLEIFNKSLKSMTSSDVDAKKYTKELKDVVVKEFKSLKYEKADKEEYRVDGEKRKCTGYVAEFSEDNMMNIIDGFEKVITKYYTEDLEALLEAQGDSLEDIFEDLREEVEDMEDIELSFYMYKNKIACIKMEDTDTDEVIEIVFQGGDYRLQNIKMTVESDSGEETLEIKGSLSDSKEKIKIITNGNKDRALEIEYNYEKGDFSIHQDSYTDIDIEGNLKASSSEIIVNLNKYYYDYDMLGGATLELTLTNKAKMGKYSGKEFDIGNASEDDLEDFADDLEDALYENDLEDAMYYF